MLCLPNPLKQWFYLHHLPGYSLCPRLSWIGALPCRPTGWHCYPPSLVGCLPCRLGPTAFPGWGLVLNSGKQLSPLGSMAPAQLGSSLQGYLPWGTGQGHPGWSELEKWIHCLVLPHTPLTLALWACGVVLMISESFSWSFFSKLKNSFWLLLK